MDIEKGRPVDDGKPPPQLPRPSLSEADGPGFPPPYRTIGAAPIVVTAMMGAADQRHFDALRTAHFPPERNYLPAHITLFRQLPPSCLDELGRLFCRIAADTPPPAAVLREVYSLGQGVAFRIESPELLAIRARIADHFAGMLTAQDRGVPRLHITVQNKVAAAKARALLAALASEFRPRQLAITGLAAHRYRGGPWDPAFTRSFRASRR
ncbi:conserved protein of unknown function [uncultured Sphingopyxis sp.]|uniref:2'-5' RNA ligase family protein n=2 Tax=uncultured Sphingopyxis sp. TaxID=310581 RepID=A0A1Y5PU70_9SPHN|nr:conserved protein of unknown function [uncultured Sphingopyxis sp.]